MVRSHHPAGATAIYRAVMRGAWLLAALPVAAAVACNTSGLSEAPRATFAQLACLDVNGDNRLNDADAADASKLPDFNADFARDADDAAYLRGIDIALDPARDASQCEARSKKTPEYLVAHGYFQPSDVSCAGNRPAVLLLGVGGGAVNVRDKEDAAGVRSIVDALMKAYDDRDIQTIGVIAAPAIGGAAEPFPAMEQWLTNAVRVYMRRFPCLDVTLVGHSHGAVSVDVVGSRLEAEQPGRIIAVVDVDRVDALYGGDIRSRPTQAYVLNLYQTNDGALSGKPYDSPNVENVDVSGYTAPERGQDGGPQRTVTHTTVDNSQTVRALIVERLMARPPANPRAR
jgi:hypothetical protein